MKLSMKKLFVFCSMVFVLFGLSSSPVAAEATDTWVTKTQMSSSRYYHEAISLNNKIYVIGGNNDNGLSNKVEEYDPLSDKWTEKARIPTARQYHQLAILNGKIYAIGGSQDSNTYLNSVEEYDPTADTWTAKSPMNSKRAEFKVTVINGKIYAIGGRDKSKTLDTIEEYNPGTNTWETKTSLKNARTRFALDVVDQKIYVLGGLGPNSAKYIEEYNPLTNTCTVKQSIPFDIQYPETAVINGKIYLVGGDPIKSEINYPSSSSLIEYNPSNDAVRTLKNMSQGRQRHQVVVINNKIYSIGGYSQGVYLKSVEEYDPANDIWTIKASFKKEKNNFKTVAISGKIYAIGGCETNNIAYSLEEYTPITSHVVSTNLIATPGNAKVDLSWTAVEGATTYNVKRSTTPGGTYEAITTTASVTYTDTNAKNGTTYYYVVSAVVKGTESGNSNEAAATPMAPTSPEEPPVITGNKGILEITMTNGDLKEYDLTATELQSFLIWYDGRSSGTGKAYYTIIKRSNVKPFLSRKEYISFDKIYSFEVKDYNE